MSSFKNSVVYQIYVKSFCDSNGDGIGDLNGIRSKLPYLKSLGVDYIWVTPFFPSPMNDNGYDVSDYRDVNPMFGTMADCEAMIAEAAELGIGFMFDMVFNHTSSRHPWFQKALAGDPEYMDYYIFRDGKRGGPPLEWSACFGGGAWEYVPELNKWYLHLFDKSQPDLNWENPKVREELKEVIRFWLGKGVKGFRFDVLNLISKPERLEESGDGSGMAICKDGPRVHEFIRELAEDTGLENYVTVGEMASTDIANCVRYTRPDSHELSMCFSFDHVESDYKDGDKWTLMEPDFRKLRNIFRDWQEGLEAQGGWSAVYWCNHDQPRVVSRFGDTGEYRKQSAKSLATFLHLLRGTPYIYEGEEVGMTNAGFTDIAQYDDVESRNNYRILLNRGVTKAEALRVLANRSRDNARTPMQWTGGRYAGFSDAAPWLRMPDNYGTINVEEAEADPDSILHYYRKLVRLRKEHPVIAEGGIRFLETGNDRVMAYERTLDGQRLTVVCSFSRHEETLTAQEILETLRGGQPLTANYPAEQRSGGRLLPYEAFAVLH